MINSPSLVSRGLNCVPHDTHNIIYTECTHQELYSLLHSLRQPVCRGHMEPHLSLSVHYTGGGVDYSKVFTTQGG